MNDSGHTEINLKVTLVFNMT